MKFLVAVSGFFAVLIYGVTRFVNSCVHGDRRHLSRQNRIRAARQARLALQRSFATATSSCGYLASGCPGVKHSPRQRHAMGRQTGWRGRAPRDRHDRRGRLPSDFSVAMNTAISAHDARHFEFARLPSYQCATAPPPTSALARPTLQAALGRSRRAITAIALAALIGLRIGEARTPGPQAAHSDTLAASPVAARQHGFDCSQPAAAEYSQFGTCGDGIFNFDDMDIEAFDPYIPVELDGVDGIEDMCPPLDDLPVPIHPDAPPLVDALIETPPFVEAYTFEGARRGAVFKTGKHGLGYYADEGVTCATATDATPIFLDSLIPQTPPLLSGTPPTLPSVPRHSPACHGHDHAGVHHAPRRRAFRRGRGPIAVSPDVVVPNMPPECSMLDQSHRASALWAIDTVNANAWDGTIAYLADSAADIAAVQETRRTSSQCPAAEREASRVGWALSLAPARSTDAERASAGVGVAAKAHIGMAHTCGGAPDEPFDGRIRCKWLGCIAKGGIHIISVYLWTAEGLSPRNLEILQSLAEIVDAIDGPWIVAGDFNMDPGLLMASKWTELAHGIIVASHLPTCGSNTRDFFVVSQRLQHAVHGVAVIHDAGLEPHSPVRLYIRAAPRAVMVRRVRAPRRFDAVLPAGCLDREAADPFAGHNVTCSTQFAPHLLGPACAALDGGSPPSLDVAFTNWITQAEEHLCNICGYDGKERDKHCGRASGPRFVIEPALGKIASPHLYSSTSSRSWRAIARWANDLRRGMESAPSTAPSAACHIATATRSRNRLTNLVLARHAPHPSPPVPRDDIVQAATDALDCRNSDGLARIAVHAIAAAKSHEASLAAKRKAAWVQHMHRGPADGIRNQHRFTRTLHGWTPVKVAAPPPLCVSNLDSTDGLILDEKHRIRTPSDLVEAPLNPQQMVDHEASAWAEQWAVGQSLPPVVWPDDLGPPLPRPTVAQIRRAAAAFPANTGLAWDRMHPKALTRLSDPMLEAFISILMSAERDGKWPAAIMCVSVVLLPKPDGGFRPIGLFPWPVRVWMKLRREMATAWEEQNDHPFLYAGRARGANVAAWKQAAHAEGAAFAKVSFGQLLLDLVKCFERVPHDVLVREAAAVGYPLPLLRLALAAYKQPRVIAINGVYSAPLVAERGITAGSALATSELRVVLLRLLVRVAQRFPEARLNVYVDDMSAEASGTSAAVEEIISEVGIALASGLRSLRLELSATKCKCSASSAKLGRAIASRLADYNVVFHKRVTSLGIGLGAGIRRNVAVQRGRFAAFRRRLAKFRCLRRARVSPANVLRTGGAAAMTYGDGILGVASSVLYARRRTIAAAISGAVRDRDIDLTLILADENEKQRLDPAFVSHAAPLSHWAEAVWNQWLPDAFLRTSMAHAKASITSAANPWSNVYGPAAATFATACRLGWDFEGHTTFITDSGRRLDLRIDPPIVVQREVHAAVARWRWRSVEDRHPHLRSEPSGNGAVVAPLRRLLRPSARNTVWTAAHQGALRSAITGTQWPQKRLFDRNLADDPFCQICRTVGDVHEAANPLAVLAEPPYGTLFHRLCTCRANFVAMISAFPDLRNGIRYIRDVMRTTFGLAEADDVYPPPCDLLPHNIDFNHRETAGNVCDTRVLTSAPPYRQGPRDASPPALTRPSVWQRFRGQAPLHTTAVPASMAEWTRALVPRPVGPRPVVPDDGTFDWVLRPAGNAVHGTFYTDGSLLDGELGEMQQLGWAFVAVSADGTRLAAASGVPPPWVQSISGAEAWAILCAARYAEEGCAFITDSMACTDAVQRGRRWATAASRPLARAWRLIFDHLGDNHATFNLKWMPAHCKPYDIGIKELSDGSKLTRRDLNANAEADLLAKRAAIRFRAPASSRTQVVNAERRAAELAVFLGIATHAANASPIPPGRDSAPTAKPGAAGTRTTNRPRTTSHTRPPSLGGHTLGKLGDRWGCSVCWRSAATRGRLAPKRCKGSAASKWARRELALVHAGTSDGRRHNRIMTDGIIWCSACGQYAIDFAVGLARPCRGRPFGPGAKACRDRLMRYLHPRSATPLHGAHYPEHGVRELAPSTHGMWGWRNIVRTWLPAPGAGARSTFATPGATRLAAVRRRILDKIARRAAARDDSQQPTNDSANAPPIDARQDEQQQIRQPSHEGLTHEPQPQQNCKRRRLSHGIDTNGCGDVPRMSSPHGDPSARPGPHVRHSVVAPRIGGLRMAYRQVNIAISVEAVIATFHERLRDLDAAVAPLVHVEPTRIGDSLTVVIRGPVFAITHIATLRLDTIVIGGNAPTKVCEVATTHAASATVGRPLPPGTDGRSTASPGPVEPAAFAAVAPVARAVKRRRLCGKQAPPPCSAGA